MIRRILLLAVLLQTAACLPIIEHKEPVVLTFDAEPLSAAPMNYADIMCCYDCAV